MHIAKSRVQFPRESRPQNINEFVDQKKEMFLVEMSYNTIKEEITSLEKKTTRKREALNESTITLQKDNDKLVKFIEEDNKRTKEASDQAEKACKERKTIEMKIKQQETKIQTVASDIDKKIDELTELERHKRFLFSIFKTVNKKWAEDVESEKVRKLHTIKR
jgi:predicted  nucleic acid-binding Zn-ribbon protein